MAWKDVYPKHIKYILIRIIWITILFIGTCIILYIFNPIFETNTRDNILESGDRFVYQHTLEDNLTYTIQGYFIAYTGGLLYYYPNNYTQSYVEVYALDVFDSYYILDKAYKSDEIIIGFFIFMVTMLSIILYLIFSLLNSYECREFKRRLLF